MEPDYPAAHSMDTLWFAVDKDGHVGCFWSGEAGAVPVEALGADQGVSGGDTGRQLDDLPECGVVLDPRGSTLALTPREAVSHVQPAEVYRDLLMFVSSPDAAREELAAGGGTPVATTSGPGVLWASLAQEAYGRLHQAGVCRGCEYYEGGETDEESVRRGVFFYRHLTDNWIAGPYGRSALPDRPIHVDQLPPALRRHVKAARFDNLCFAETPHIQPVEHGACESWQGAYIDITGKCIRPIPGKEDEYADRYPMLSDMKAEFEVEPPPAEPEEPNE